MESRFGQDFADVRIHRGANAEASAGDLNAIAYTTGSHIVFGPGAYQPQAPEGRRLLAHELSHVLQQRRGPVTGEPAGGMRVSRNDDSFERAADVDAAAALSGSLTRAAPGAGPRTVYGLEASRVPAAVPAGTAAPPTASVQRQDLDPSEPDTVGLAADAGTDCSCSDDDALAYQSETGADTLEASGDTAGPLATVQTFPDPSVPPGDRAVQRQPVPPAGQAPDAGVPPAPDAGPAPQDLPAPCSPDAKACFSISKKTAWLKLASGNITVPALGGRKGHPTPRGKSFTVISKDRNHRSSLYKKKGKGAPMPFYVHFAPAVGFHAGSLATPSHGCVHLSASDAEKFFKNLEVGDRVDVVE